MEGLHTYVHILYSHTCAMYVCTNLEVVLCVDAYLYVVYMCMS